jgi:hypothetical protein
MRQANELSLIQCARCRAASRLSAKARFARPYRLDILRLGIEIYCMYVAH